MTIPCIKPYYMLNKEDIPDNVASWRIDPKRSLLLIHDMQEYFIQKFVPDQQPVIDMIRNIVLLREYYSKLGFPVAYTAQPGAMSRKQRGLLRDFWGDGMTAEQNHRNIIQPLCPRENDIVFTKWRYSAFYKSGLLKFMHEVGKDQIIICGVYAHVGCLMTACDAFTNDIETFIIADAIADFSIDYHKQAILYAAQNFAVIQTTDSVILSLTE